MADLESIRNNEDYSTQEELKCQKDINGLKNRRELTMEISTRWYRAPEVILCEESYDFKIDMWSIGCMLAELISCSKKSKTNGGRDGRRKAHS